MLSRPSVRTVAYSLGALGTTSAAYYGYQRATSTMRNPPSAAKTFDLRIRVRGPDGKPATQVRTLPQLSSSEVDSKLREHAVEQSVRRPGGIGEHRSRICQYTYSDHQNL